MKINEMIVKVQVPLSTNAKIPEALIYNEDKSIFVMIPFDENIRKKMNGHLKLFFFCKFDNSEIKLMGNAPWQDW